MSWDVQNQADGDIVLIAGGATTQIGGKVIMQWTDSITAEFGRASNSSTRSYFALRRADGTLVYFTVTASSTTLTGSTSAP